MTHRITPTHRISRALRPLALAAAAAAVLATSLPATAALVARNLDGDTSTAEAYFDTTLGITWLRDTDRLANVYGLATTMSYAAATTALAAFNADSALNFGYSGWRLPGASGVHLIGGAGCQFGFGGSSDCGENVDTASSELASMFHDTLGNLSWRDTTGSPRAGIPGVDFGLVDTEDFTDLTAVGYWSGTTSYRLIFGVPQNGQVVFNLGNGTQGISVPTALNAAWLVHDGDIGGAVVPAAGAVPLPGSLGLAALGLAALGPLLARRRHATA